MPTEDLFLFSLKIIPQVGSTQTNSNAADNIKRLRYLSIDSVQYSLNDLMFFAETELLSADLVVFECLVETRY